MGRWEEGGKGGEGEGEEGGNGEREEGEGGMVCWCHVMSVPKDV